MDPVDDPFSVRRFEEIFVPHLGAAYNLARWLLSNEQDAEDAVQEAYLRACKSFHQFRGDNGKAWLLTIVRNVCYKSGRKPAGFEGTEPFDEEAHGLALEAGGAGDLQSRIDGEVLRSALESLSPEFREVIVLHELEGMSYKEIAAVADIPIGTVMSRLTRARQHLRKWVCDTIQSKEGGA